jgi:hypothetical protein
MDRGVEHHVAVAKYDGLRDFLAAQVVEVGEVSMTFPEVAQLVGPLPESATKHRAWWANDSKVQARAWRSAGWRVDSVDQGAGRVVFVGREVRAVRGKHAQLSDHSVVKVQLA